MTKPAPFGSTDEGRSPDVRAFWQLSLWEWALVSAVVLAFVQFFWLPQDVFFSPDEGLRVIASRHVRPDSLLTARIPYPNADIDPQAQLVPLYRWWFRDPQSATLRLSYGVVWMGALIAPLELLGGVQAVRVLSLVCGLLVAWLVASLLRAVGHERVASLGFVISALGLPISPYSLLVWEHQLAVAMVLLAVLGFLRWSQTRHSAYIALALISALLGLLFRVETAFVLVALVLGWVVMQAVERHANARYWLVAALVMMALGALYLALTRDTPRAPVLTFAFNPSLVIERWWRIVAGFDVTFATALGALCAAGLALLSARAPRYSDELSAAGALMMGVVLVASLFKRSPFGMDNPGLLTGAPVLILALLPPRGRLRWIWWSCGVLLTGLIVGGLFVPRLLALASGVMAQIGSTWGSRYLLAVYPLLLLAALPHVERWLDSGKRWLQGALAVLIALGLSVNAFAVARMRVDKQLTLPNCLETWQGDVPIVITDDWWRAAECAAQKPTLRYLYLDRTEDLPALRQALAAARVERVAYLSEEGYIPLDLVVTELETCFEVTVLQMKGSRSELALRPRSGICEP